MIPIPGTSRIAHADENIDAAWVALDASDIARIDDAAGACTDDVS